MKKKLRNTISSILTVAVTGAIMTACSSAIDEPDGDGGIQPDAVASVLAISRANTGDNDFQFGSGDAIGLYMVNYSGSTAGSIANSSDRQITNLQLIYGQQTSSTGEFQTEFYWKDSQTNADFVAYYPYAASISNPASYRFTLSAASMHANDFLWGKTSDIKPTALAISLRMNHVFSLIDINIVYGNGFDETSDAVTSVSLKEFPEAVAIDLGTGELTPDMTSLKTLTAFKQSDSNWQAIVIPHSRQTMTGGQLIVVETAKDSFVLKNDADMTFISGKRYTATLTLDKTAGGINIGIGGWEVVDDDFGGTVN